MAVVEIQNICANCSACSLRSLNNGFYHCRRFDIAVKPNETCGTIDLLETRPIRHLAAKALARPRALWLEQYTRSKTDLIVTVSQDIHTNYHNA